MQREKTPYQKEVLMKKNTLRIVPIVVAFSVGIFAQAQTVITSVISLDTDDQEETVSDGSLDIASSDLELCEEGVTADHSKAQFIGLRFQSVAIPQNAIIKSAYVQFTSDNDNDEPTLISIKGEASDSAATFGQNSFSVSSRETGVNEVLWTPAPWTTDYAPEADLLDVQGTAQKTSNIRSIIQEIVDRAGWKENNALALILSGTGEREAESFEGANSHGDGSLAATLIVEYDLPTSLSYTISLDTDDQEESVADGALDYASSDLELAEEGVTTNNDKAQLIGLRFTGIDVPQGAVIKSARIQFTSDNDNDELTELVIKAEATDSAATFAQESFSVSSRVTGSSSIEWKPEAWTTDYAPGGDDAAYRGLNQLSPNLATVVQEVINRDGWKAGNALALIITGTGEREAESFEGASGHGTPEVAPTLILDYTLPETLDFVVGLDTDDQEESVADGALDYASSDLELGEEGVTTNNDKAQLIGLRFTDIQIPQGAYITNSYIQFTADNDNDETTFVTIKGEATDSSATFAQESFSVSSRITGSASADWNPAPWTTDYAPGADSSAFRGLNQRTVSINSVIQEIINRAGWKEGNALSLIITGTGEREAESFEGASDHGNAGLAPTLHIEYALVNAPQGVGVAPIGSFPIAKDAIWRYLDNGSDQGSAWTALDFDDASWKFGAAELGYGENDESTVLSYGSDINQKHITYYLRHLFEVSEESFLAADSIELSLLVDDGAVVYLNGVEVVRTNMPAGAIDNTTLANLVTGDAEGIAYTFTIAKDQLTTGTNCLAVEVHQNNGASSDLSFSLEANAARYNEVLIPMGAEWRFDDKGNDLGSTWTAEAFDDASWDTGLATLGYGNGNENQVVAYGADAANKNITTYFRKNFVVTDTTGRSALALKVNRDDGVVVYINGSEVYRNNMPAGSIDYTTTALTFIEGATEDELIEATVDKSVLKIGDNNISVEIHQNSATSNDIAFDMELFLPAEDVAVSFTGYHVNCDPSATEHISCFTSVVPQDQHGQFEIPKATHDFQLIVKSLESVYNTSGSKVPNGNDFTGFIPDNGSSTKGWLSINHENTPGAVSIVSLHFDEQTNLWVVDSINAVDFAPVVQTTRNCSGGVTPWGTVITSEETYNGGDANSDGFTDVGWQVEIDPRTHSIVDYDNDGTPDKLWALGRFSHENIVLANDSITAYQAEDGGTGGVYKFVADEKMNLSKGTLYVLQRDDIDETIGRWIVVPNSTQEEMNTTRALAASVGGTRWGGCEDVEIHPLTGEIFFTEKGNGDTWKFTDNGMTVSGIEQFLSNENYPIYHSTGTVQESYRTGNDNLTFDDMGNLWVLQDGGRNFIWMAYADHTPANPHVEIFMTTPKGSEPTGMTFTPDHKYMFLSIQNPSGSNSEVQVDAAGNEVVTNSSVTMVISRKEFLGSNGLKPEFELPADTTICSGSELIETIEGIDATVFVNGQAIDNYDIVITEADTYEVKAIGNNGLSTIKTMTVKVSDLPIVDLGDDRELADDPIVLDAGAGFASYLWNTDETTQTISVDEKGTYSVVVTNDDQCAGTDEVFIDVVLGYTENNEMLFNLSAYPNPFNGTSNIKFVLTESSEVTLDVYSTDGVKLTTLTDGDLAAGTHQFDFTPALGENSTGIYFVKLNIGGETTTLKIVAAE